MSRAKYRNISKRKLLKALRKIEWRVDGFSIVHGSEHYLKLQFISAKRPYPLPFNHPTIKDWVVEGVKDWLVQNEVCNEADFDKELKIETLKKD